LFFSINNFNSSKPKNSILALSFALLKVVLFIFIGSLEYFVSFTFSKNLIGSFKKSFALLNAFGVIT